MIKMLIKSIGKSAGCRTAYFSAIIDKYAPFHEHSFGRLQSGQLAPCISFPSSRELAASGPYRTFRPAGLMSASGGKPDMPFSRVDVR
jgi:hypothetical protein